MSDYVAASKRQRAVQAQTGGGMARLDDRRSGLPPAQLKDLRPRAAGGLPSQLAHGIETLSGVSMAGVRVHYNSAKPAAMQAHAYAQGHDIHVASGQEKHLPHEAWHVVQQAQGRVKPTMSMGGVDINDSAALEGEADRMGHAALSAGKS